MKRDDTPGVILPPPLLYAGALALGLALDRFLLRMPTGFSEPARDAVAGVLAAAAVALILAALLRFRRVGTPAEPWRPTTAIVTSGVYRLTRNPMYLAMTLLYLAAAVVADSLITLLLVLPLLAVVHYGVIRREERYLEAKFGDEYRRYRAAVRRWL